MKRPNNLGRHELNPSNLAVLLALHSQLPGRFRMPSSSLTLVIDRGTARGNLVRLDDVDAEAYRRDWLILSDHDREWIRRLIRLRASAVRALAAARLEEERQARETLAPGPRSSDLPTAREVSSR
jgi:DNA-binding MarR family transcriptional regulator